MVGVSAYEQNEVAKLCFRKHEIRIDDLGRDTKEKPMAAKKLGIVYRAGKRRSELE